MTQQDIAPQASEEFGSARSQRGPRVALAARSAANLTARHTLDALAGEMTCFLEGGLNMNEPHREVARRIDAWLAAINKVSGSL